MKVSILIPLYNSEKYISQTLECALNQSWQDKEIIVVDDGSIDSSLSIARSYECDTLRVFSQKNKGASAARNYAFSKSTGEYIQYLDADDLMEDNKIEKQINYIKQSSKKNILVYSAIEIFENKITNIITPNTTFRNKSYSYPFDLLNEMFLLNKAILLHSYLVHKNLVEKSGGWNEALSTNDDGEFFARIISLSSCVKFVPDTFVYYRNTPASLSKLRKDKNAKSDLLSLKLVSDLMIQKNPSEKTRMACSKRCNDFIHKWLLENKPLLKDLESYMKANNFTYDLTEKSKRYILLEKLIGWRRIMLLKQLLRN